MIKMTVNDVWFLVKVFVVLLIFKLGCHCQEAGSPCTVKSTGEPGVCKISNECPTVEDQAKRGISPTICGFYQLLIPIVCCENQVYSLPSPNDLATGEDSYSFTSDEAPNSQETKKNQVNYSFLSPNDLAIGGDSISFPSDEAPNLQENSYFGGAARKSEQKCLEYTKTVMDVVHAIPLVPNVEPIIINVTKCEYNSVALIVGGSPASVGEFPFMAAIGFPDSEGEPEWRCGGSLISDKWVLTAAHCTFSREGDPKWIRVGDLDLSRAGESDHRDYEIDKLIAHPEYKYPQKYNDIALISTTKTVKFSKVIRPACLNIKSNIPQKVAIATGWGQTDFSASNSEKLLKVRLNIYSNRECKRAYKNENKLTNGIVDTMLCAGDLGGGKDTCLGDSGGPLFITEKENMCKFHIIGVTSFGKLCAQVNTPAVYTKVSEYIDWIENTIW